MDASFILPHIIIFYNCYALIQHAISNLPKYILKCSAYKSAHTLTCGGTNKTVYAKEK